MKKITVILVIICLAAVGYFAVAKRMIESGKLYDAGRRVLTWGGNLEVVSTYVGGTTVFPEFYMNLKNRGKEEIIYIKALFRVYDWESDRLKAEKETVLLDYELDVLTIKPGRTKTVKTGLLDLRYKKDDFIKYKFTDIQTREYK